MRFSRGNGKISSKNSFLFPFFKFVDRDLAISFVFFSRFLKISVSESWRRRGVGFSLTQSSFLFRVQFPFSFYFILFFFFFLLFHFYARRPKRTFDASRRYSFMRKITRGRGNLEITIEIWSSIVDAALLEIISWKSCVNANQNQFSYPSRDLTLFSF